MKNQYTISEMISNAYALVITRVFYRGARLIRRPFYCRGKSRLSFGKGFTTGYNCRFDLLDEQNNTDIRLSFGINCKIGDNVHIVASEKVVIGDNCLMASKIFISDTSHGDYSSSNRHTKPEIAPDARPLISNPVIIGNNVWVGENVTILPGVIIGDGCIIGANAVVNCNVMKNCIIGGVPAKTLKIWNNNTGKWIKPSS